MHLPKVVIVILGGVILLLTAATAFLIGRSGESPAADSISDDPVPDSIKQAKQLPASTAESQIVPEATPERVLPDGYKWGRCLLVVEKQTRISGRCSYTMSDEGDFEINGPQQIFSGIDYPESQAQSDRKSADYWATVYRDGEGWSGYGNGEITSTHGGNVWSLKRDGACLTNSETRICLWKS